MSISFTLILQDSELFCILNFSWKQDLDVLGCGHLKAYDRRSHDFARNLELESIFDRYSKLYDPGQYQPLTKVSPAHQNTEINNRSFQAPNVLYMYWIKKPTNYSDNILLFFLFWNVLCTFHVYIYVLILYFVIFLLYLELLNIVAG